VNRGAGAQEANINAAHPPVGEEMAKLGFGTHPFLFAVSVCSIQRCVSPNLVGNQGHITIGQCVDHVTTERYGKDQASSRSDMTRAGSRQ
jgi:hypothetical protein